MHPGNVGAAEAVRRVADRAWREMQEHGVLPTPRNFELWVSHLENTHSKLSRQLSEILLAGQSPTPRQLQSLYEQNFTQEFDVGALASQSEQLSDVAQHLLGSIVTNQDSLHAYGALLLSADRQIRHDQTVDGLLRVVSSLAQETSRASERNRHLEQQLASSATRISKLRTELSDARESATTDSLTGLRNRRAFDSRLRLAIRKARSEEKPMCLLLLDVDHFKRFNDEHGHSTGDLVLRLVAGIIAENVKGRDVAARYGGEEFAVILTQVGLVGGLAVAEQIRGALEGKHLAAKGLQKRPNMVTLSVGVAQSCAADNSAALIERADAALYRAKQQGRNRVCAEVFDEPG